MRSGRPRAGSGFTLIELLVVLAVLALLVTIAVPRYVDHVERAREGTLHASLRVMREAIDKFEADSGRLPVSLQELVERRYLRDIPPDPITGARDTWVPVASTDLPARNAENGEPGGQAAPVRANAENPAGMVDVRSGAPGNGRDGTPYTSW